MRWRFLSERKQSAAEAGRTCTVRPSKTAAGLVGPPSQEAIGEVEYHPGGPVGATPTGRIMKKPPDTCPLCNGPVRFTPRNLFFPDEIEGQPPEVERFAYVECKHCLIHSFEDDWDDERWLAEDGEPIGKTPLAARQVRR